jgi:hypothetical protein
MALVRASSKSRKPLIAAAWLPGWMNFFKMNRRTFLDPDHLFLRASLASESLAFAVFAASLSARPTKVSIFQSFERWLAAGMFHMPPSFKVFTSKSLNGECRSQASGGVWWHR